MMLFLVRINKMTKNSKKAPLSLWILFLASLLMISPMTGIARAAESETSETRGSEKKESDSGLKFHAEAGIEYTDNAFRLTESQISKMEENAGEDTVGGRFKDMDSVSDCIISPELGLSFSSDSPLGGKFSMTSWLRYNYYSSNQAGSFPEGRIRLKNTLGQKGALTGQVKILSDFFKKNYMSGINDENGNGNLTREERIYSPAVYDEYEGTVSYEHKIINEKDSSVSGLDLQPFAGVAIRCYNSTFSNRDQDIIFMGMGVNLEFMSRIDVEVIYQYEWVSSPDDSELILFDETLLGTDVNDDEVIKVNAPVITDIDRSSERYSIEIKPAYKFSKDTLIFLGYRKRVSAYESDNRLDIEHFNQRAYRDQISAGIRHDFSKAWSAEAEYRRVHEDEEDGEYSENSCLVKVKYDF